MGTQLLGVGIQLLWVGIQPLGVGTQLLGVGTQPSPFGVELKFCQIVTSTIPATAIVNLKRWMKIPFREILVLTSKWNVEVDLQPSIFMHHGPN